MGWIAVVFSSLTINSQVIYTKLCDPVLSAFGIYKMSPMSACYFSLIQFLNNTEWNTTDSVILCPSSLYTMDSTLMWLLVPHILHGFGYIGISSGIHLFSSSF